MEIYIAMLITITTNICLTVIIVKKLTVRIIKNIDNQINTELSQINSSFTEVFNYEKSIIKCRCCGNEIDIEDNYCNRCGLKLTK